MLQMFGVNGTMQDGVFFTEFAPAGEDLGPVNVEISRQNADLFMVKAEMARRALATGANVVAQFEYGQAKNGILFWRWDSEHWFGRGRLLRVSE